MANSYEKVSQIKFISECFVKPKYIVEASKQPHYLGVVDLGLLSIDQLQRGLLFPTTPNNIHSDLLQKLTESLSISLVHFYPFAGQFDTKNFPDEDAVCVYLDCNKGPGARIIHAAADITVGDLLSSVDVHPIVSSLFDLGEKAINYDGQTRPLLSIQVTELLDGVFIGFTMNHSLVDGNTQWQFIAALSEIFLHMNECDQEDDVTGSICVSRKPIFKPFFPDQYGPIVKLPVHLLNERMKWRSDPGLLRERIFHFSSASISKLKANANEECGVHNISSFQALSALVWMSITRARDLQLDDVETTLALAVNARPRLYPPLSNEYFGNFIVRSRIMCKARELMSNGLGWAAMSVHQMVVSQDDKLTRGFFEEMAKLICGAKAPEPSQFNEPNLVMIGDSPRFDMYGPEFGLGKAIAGLAGYSNKEDGKVTASPGREGGGSVDLEICLRPESMNSLELDEEFMSFVTVLH